MPDDPLTFELGKQFRGVRIDLYPRVTARDPLTFELGKQFRGVRISIRASGHGGLVRIWRRFSGYCYEDNEKIDLCVALWERQHWLQVSALDNAVRKFKEDSDPLDLFTHVINGLCRLIGCGNGTQTLAVELALGTQRSCSSLATSMGSSYRGLVPEATGIGCGVTVEELLD
ncbi:hypothetical protein PHMEG_00035911 [Phytophthora megakarya]|uniref:Uncharacterized protein n=1 Tax=Phytophthora megakarya TaxID=4795 RepID=A0A225UN55_9STRA|nr:hypothetical protein PHMEG_00035911 [Phytophthora megakarya]